MTPNSSVVMSVSCLTIAMMPHPLSVLRAPDGRQVQLKVHRCVWSGDFPANSLPAIRECLTAAVARADIGINLLHDGDFVVPQQRQEDRPLPLSQVIELLQIEASPTLLELDARDVEPWPWPRVWQLARLIEPVRDRIIFGSRADWNLRRLAYVDPQVRLAFTPSFYLDWVPPNVEPDELPGEVGAYGYRDRHPLARRRQEPTADYLWERLSALVRLVPGVCEMHIRLTLFEHMQSDGLAGVRAGVWTLDAGTPDWQARLNNAVWATADTITTTTAQQLALAPIR
jgi:hypothetical protein